MTRETFVFNALQAFLISHEDDKELSEELTNILENIDIAITVSEEQCLISAVSYGPLFDRKSLRSIQIRRLRHDSPKPSLEAPLPRERPL
jgi:hypothetical protein